VLDTELVCELDLCSTFVHHTIWSTFVTVGSFTAPHLLGFLLAFEWV